MTNQTPRSALIIGCGVAGAASAIFLRRLGLQVTVAEAYPEPAGDEGGALMVAPNGMRVLNQLGVAAAVRASGAVVESMFFEDGEGERLAGIAVGTSSLPRAIMIARADLQKHLTAAAIAAGATVQYSAKLAGLDTTGPGPVVARFASGSEISADLVIGADGLHSAVRWAILGDGPAASPRYTGLTTIGGFAEGRAHDTALAGLHMVFAASGFFAYAAIETAAPGRVMWWTSLPFDLSDLQRSDAPALRQRVLDLCDTLPQPLPGLMAASSRVIKTPIYDLDPLPAWSAGRVLLIGDAAHAMPPHAGQGASMALEDALFLAHCLKGGAEPEAAFRRFHDLRAKRVAALQKQSRRNGAGKQSAGPGARRMQKLMMRLFAPVVAATQNRTFAYRLPSLS